MRKTAVYISALTMVVLFMMNFSSCFYDSEDYLYPEVVCDTVYNYNGGIKAIMDRQCARSGCHAGAEPEASLALTTYDEVRTGVEDLLILCNIRHESACVPMPKNEDRIPDCEIHAIEKWQELGFPEN